MKEDLKTSDAEYYLEARIILSLQGQPRHKCNTGLHIQKPHILPSQVDQRCILLISMNRKVKASLERTIKEDNQWKSELEETRAAKWNNALLTEKLAPNFCNLFFPS